MCTLRVLMSINTANMPNCIGLLIRVSAVRTRDGVPIVKTVEIARFQRFFSFCISLVSAVSAFLAAKLALFFVYFV